MISKILVSNTCNSAPSEVDRKPIPKSDSKYNAERIYFGNEVFVHINMTLAIERFGDFSNEFQKYGFNNRFLRIEKCIAKFNDESVILIENQCPTKIDFVQYVSVDQHAIEFKMINFKGKNSARFELICDLCKYLDILPRNSEPDFKLVPNF